MPWHSGQRRHPTSDRGSGVTANLRRKSGDPTGLMRHQGKGANGDNFQNTPSMPGISVYGYQNTWEFKTAYDVNSTNVWTQVTDGTGTVLTVQDERGGVAKFTNPAGDNDHYYYYSKYEIAKLASGKDLWLVTRIKIADVDQADWAVGLGHKASWTADDLFDSREDFIGFYGEDGSAVVNCECTKNTSNTSQEAAPSQFNLEDATFKKLAIHVLSTESVFFFVDNEYVAAIGVAANIPEDQTLAFVFGCRNGQASANSMSIGWTHLTQDE